MPSPLDKLDPLAIPSLERFDWQPKELVAVLGEHRGRPWTPVNFAGLSYSADGKTILSQGIGEARLWDIRIAKNTRPDLARLIRTRVPFVMSKGQLMGTTR